LKINEINVKRRVVQGLKATFLMANEYQSLNSELYPPKLKEIRAKIN